MGPLPDSIRLDKRVMAYTAAAMYGAAAIDGAIEGLVPGDPRFAIAPAVAAPLLVVFLVLLGPHLPRMALALLGPIGAGLIASALATTPGAGDGAVLYMLPVLWSAFFFGRRGAVVIIACIAVAHALALLSLPASSSYPGRWIDVMVSVSVVAAVTLALVARNDQLLVRLAGEARTDELTGLLNRRGFDERAALELARARRTGQSIALVMFDLDHFKHINDEWGHETGDRVLARAGAILANHSRDIDITARLGGEEFVALLPGSDSAEAEDFTQRVRRALVNTDTSTLPPVRTSAGVHATNAPDDIEALLRNADSALYEAKRAGRDRTVTYRSDAHTASARPAVEA